MASERPPTIWLDTGEGARAPVQLTVGSSIVGRRDDVAVRISDQMVSNHHAELYWDGDRLRLRDLGSTNGTTVNADAVVDWIDLRDGDVVRFGTVDGVISLAGPDETPARRPQPPPRRAVEHRPSSRPVFVSHASEDKRQARAIAGYLRERGWEVWIDEEGIAGGKDWREELIVALESSWIVVLLVSRHSMTSRWVLREIHAADRLGLRIIPVAVEDVPYPDSLRMILSGVQRLDATDLDGDDGPSRLARVDDALVRAARARTPGRPGRVRIVVGTVLATIGGIGLIVAFGIFFWFGYQWMQTSEGGASPSGPGPFLAFPVFFASMVVAGVGQGLRQSGLRAGI